MSACALLVSSPADARITLNGVARTPTSSCYYPMIDDYVGRGMASAILDTVQRHRHIETGTKPTDRTIRENIAVMLAGDLGYDQAPGGEPLISHKTLTTLGARIQPLIEGRKIDEHLAQALIAILEETPERTLHLVMAMGMRLHGCSPARSIALAEAIGIVDVASRHFQRIIVQPNADPDLPAHASIDLNAEVRMSDKVIDAPRIPPTMQNRFNAAIAAKARVAAKGIQTGHPVKHHDVHLQARDIFDNTFIYSYDVPIVAVLDGETARTTFHIKPYKTTSYGELRRVFDRRD